MPIFLAVADTGQLLEAAKLLGHSTTYIAKVLNELEEDIGTRLFTRGQHEVKITAAGRTLYGRWKSAKEHFLRGLQIKSDYDYTKEDITVRIGAPPGECGVLAECIQDRLALADRINFEFCHVEQLRSYTNIETLDFFFSTEPIRSDFWEFEPFFEDKWVIVHPDNDECQTFCAVNGILEFAALEKYAKKDQRMMVEDLGAVVGMASAINTKALLPTRYADLYFGDRRQIVFRAQPEPSKLYLGVKYSQMQNDSYRWITSVIRSITQSY